MRRLVICCDGTWKRSDDPRVSNIEKIARAVRPVATDGTNQVVFSHNGVGTGGLADRLIGGAFGVGLDDAIIAAYRFLALNYQLGDQIYVFGFSRGAYTARSLVGMISRIGLLTPKGVVDNHLQTAMRIYRNRPREGTNEEIETFRRATYRDDMAPKIRFLGVFDTVGALGVPGITRKHYKFHDVELTTQVERARQALAIDERRLTFAPCMWSTRDNKTTDIKQVWFEGVHSDIGGGYERTAPADITLRWMVGEAQGCGLEFDFDLFPELQSKPLSPNKSMKLTYRMINTVKLFARPLQPRRTLPPTRGDRRLLAKERDDEVTSTLWIALPAYDRWREDIDNRVRQAPNIGWWTDWAGDLTPRVETIPPLGPPSVSSPSTAASATAGG
jgi:uncharacterized protein (DUF2235 family)